VRGIFFTLARSNFSAAMRFAQGQNFDAKIARHVVVAAAPKVAHDAVFHVTAILTHLAIETEIKNAPTRER
jgi:hypothetical protein